MIWGGILVGVALWSISALIFTLYHVINGVIALHRFIDDLDRSIYKTGAFLLGPIFLLGTKYSSAVGLAARTRVLFHLKRAFIGLGLLVVVVVLSRLLSWAS